MGWCRAGPEHPGQGHTAGHAPQRPSGAPEGPPGPRLLPKAVLLRWLQEGTRRLLLTPRPWPLAEGGRVQGTVAQAGGCVRGAIWILGSTWVPRGGGGGARSVLPGLGSVVLPLAGVPQQERDPDGREGHDPEGRPVQLRKQGGVAQKSGVGAGEGPDEQAHPPPQLGADL